MLCHFGLSKALKKQLWVAQNNAIRFNLGLKSKTHIGFAEFCKLPNFHVPNFHVPKVNFVSSTTFFLMVSNNGMFFHQT